MSGELEVRQPPSQPMSAKVQFCQMLAGSGMLPRQYQGNPANLLWAVEYASMLGLSPMAAVTGVHVIEGKPSASAGLISALVRRAGHRLRVTGDDTSAVATITRADDPDFEFRSEWTMDRARKAGLTGKKVWTQYPAAMLKARAITEVARDACEDALSGLHYTAEELGAEVTEEGAPVAAGGRQGAPQQQPVPAPQGDDVVPQETAQDNDTVPELPAPAVLSEQAAKKWTTAIRAATDPDGDLRRLYVEVRDAEKLGDLVNDGQGGVKTLGQLIADRKAALEDWYEGQGAPGAGGEQE